MQIAPQRLVRVQVLMLLLFGCSDKSLREESDQRSTSSASEDSDASNGGSTTEGAGAKAKTKKRSSTSGGGVAGDGVDGDEIDGGDLTPEEYFNLILFPKFEAQCHGCHAPPREMPIIEAPLTIYSYSQMKEKLKSGNSPVDNGFINKVRNLVSHNGGDRCAANGYSESPCAEITVWWEKEHGMTGSFLAGTVQSVSSRGIARGWAINAKVPDEQVSIVLYVDGNKDQKTALARMKASEAGFDSNNPGDHAFSFTLPATYADGKNHDLYAYSEVNGELSLLSGLPVRFTAYTPRAVGRQFYEQNLQGVLTGSCGACHAVSYDQHYGSLLTPPPYEGGTALENQMINYPAGGNNHPGGNLCGSKNGSPCSLMQQWWALEFN